MTEQPFTEEFIQQLKAVTNKRPKTVIEHILKYGYITTEELKSVKNHLL